MTAQVSIPDNVIYSSKQETSHIRLAFIVYLHLSLVANERKVLFLLIVVAKHLASSESKQLTDCATIAAASK